MQLLRRLMRAHISLNQFDQAEAVVSKQIDTLRVTPSLEAAEQLEKVDLMMKLWVQSQSLHLGMQYICTCVGSDPILIGC